ncbi:WD40 repeat, conserved site [Phytophthora cactorum]|nr:WD40 repeat, conserved site [Phytophthora cactorum]
MAITSDEVNFLVYRYLQESGFLHSAFTFAYESQLAKSSVINTELPPGALVSFMQKGLQYVGIEAHINEVRMNDVDKLDKEALVLLSGHEKEVYACSWNPVKNILVSGSSDSTARVWSLPNKVEDSKAVKPKVLSHGTGPHKDVTTLEWNDAELDEATSAALVYTLQEHKKEVYTFRWSCTGPGTSLPDQPLTLASASFDGTVKLWDAESGSCRRTFDHQYVTCDAQLDAVLTDTNAALGMFGYCCRYPVYGVAFSPDGEYLASGTADLDSEGLLILAEQPTPQPELFPPPSDSSDDEFYESQDDSDSLHERDDVDDVAGLAQNAGHPAKEQGRIRQLVELLTLQSHNVGDARSALVDKLLGVVKVNELVLTRATEEQIANAANDAITDEILASVDQEERRRNELAVKDQEMVPASTSTLEQLSPFRVLELVDVLDSTTGGMVKRVLTKVRRRAPLNARMERDNEMDRAVEFCRFCSAKKCPQRSNGSLSSPSNSRYAQHADDTSPALSPGKATAFCTFCRRNAAHTTNEHVCRVCRAVGLHRSDGCPQRSSNNTVLSYSVDAASKVRDRVLETIPQVLPPPAATLVWRSLDKVGDADLILRKTLQRIGVWGGGSQTPITTPYAPPSASSSNAEKSIDGPASHDCDRYPPELKRVTSASSASSNSSAPLMPNEGQSSGVYVLSYAEGHSVVPARILKYMRLLMHHEVSTNAFSVVVRFDPRPSHWELMKPGMVSPRSLPSSPTLSHQLQKRMAHYTLQTLLGARDKLRELDTARRKLEQIQAQRRKKP